MILSYHGFEAGRAVYMFVRWILS